MDEKPVDVSCGCCGTYLFSECIKDGRWKFVKQPTVDYRYFPEKEMFLCGKCAAKQNER